MADTEMLEDQLQASDDEMGSAYEPQEGGAMLADEAGPATFEGDEHSFTAMEDDNDPQEASEAPQEAMAMESDDLETAEPEIPQLPVTSSALLPFTSVDAQVPQSNNQNAPEQSQPALHVSPPALETAQQPPLTLASQPQTSSSTVPATQLETAPSSTEEQPSEALEEAAPQEAAPPQTEEGDATAVSATQQTQSEETVDVQDEKNTLDRSHVQDARPVGEGSEADPAEQEDLAAQDADVPASSESADASHSSEAESNEDGTQPAPRIDLLQSVEMPASLATYLEPTDEGHLPTEDNNDLENIRAPPVLLSCAGQTYWLFADMKNDTPASDPGPTAEADEEDVQAPVASTSKAGAADKGTEGPAHPVLFAKEHELYYAPLAKIFDHLHDQFPAFQDDQMEIRLCVQELGIEIPEDNAYAGELTIHDLDRLHIGCDLSGRLHIVLSEAPRFIYRFNTLARHVAKFASVQPAVEVSHGEEDEKADAEEPLLNDNDLTEAVVVDEQVLTGEAPDPEDRDDIAAELRGDEFTEPDRAEQGTEDQAAEVLDSQEDHLDDVPAQTTEDKLSKDAGAPPAELDPTLAAVTDPDIQDASEEASTGVPPVDSSHAEAVAVELADDAPTVQPEELEVTPGANPQIETTNKSTAIQQAEEESALASAAERPIISPKRGREEDGELEGSLTPTDPHDAKRVKAG